MKLPPEPRSQIYDSLFEDALHDIRYRGALDEFPQSGIRPQYSPRVAVHRHIKSTMAILHTNHILRVEAIDIAYHIASGYVESTKISLDRVMQERKRSIVSGMGTSYQLLLEETELRPRYNCLCSIRGALRVVMENLFENRAEESVKSCSENQMSEGGRT
jgi:hypothetical protein